MQPTVFSRASSREKKNESTIYSKNTPRIDVEAQSILVFGRPQLFTVFELAKASGIKHVLHTTLRSVLLTG